MVETDQLYQIVHEAVERFAVMEFDGVRNEISHVKVRESLKNILTPQLT